ncbi:endoglucanase family protein [Mycolicibacterium flavescens]|uniref:glycoside hydrolase family 26 protein n=1 Tax=Mycobacterium sp. 852002-51152_SCH6134967 TaxID=1834096 RepID=UPI000801321B|nr:glycosyl hydrolase [Mycobacterium sp. 852002-51152_SCH6134967]OBF89197.1 endoglucanase [Mycobacterium sp. 852002-51152_SCH6134967]VEG46247.1 endoglucanase family protein [Mycolicibacterium flavescens]
MDALAVRFGVSTPGGFTAGRELQAVADAVGHRPEMVMAFEDFFAPPPIPAMAVVTYGGAEPIVSWEPWCWTGDRSPALMESLRAGALDDHIYRWADEIGEWGRHAFIRFAHEFNGNWYPWTPPGGTTPSAYVSAWRHVHDIFTEKDVSNVDWIWAPTVGGAGILADWYPGHEYVDVLGVDGYNWGTCLPSSNWVSPEQLFGAVLDELRSIATDKPILIAEVGCAESGGSKAEWIASFVEFLQQQRDVVGFVWFDHVKETDWRIESTLEAAAAMAEAMRDTRLVS